MQGCKQCVRKTQIKDWDVLFHVSPLWQFVISYKASSYHPYCIANDIICRLFKITFIFAMYRCFLKYMVLSHVWKRNIRFVLNLISPQHALKPQQRYRGWIYWTILLTRLFKFHKRRLQHWGVYVLVKTVRMMRYITKQTIIGHYIFQVVSSWQMTVSWGVIIIFHCNLWLIRNQWWWIVEALIMCFIIQFNECISVYIDIKLLDVIIHRRFSRGLAKLPGITITPMILHWSCLYIYNNSTCGAHCGSIHASHLHAKRCHSHVKSN